MDRQVITKVEKGTETDMIKADVEAEIEVGNEAGRAEAKAERTADGEVVAAEGKDGETDGENGAADGKNGENVAADGDDAAADGEDQVAEVVAEAGNDIAALIAEAEARGYERARRERIEEWMSEGSGNRDSNGGSEDYGEVMILNNLRPSVWEN